MLLVAIAAMVFVSCSKDDDTDPFDAGGEGIITMTTEGEEINFVIGTEAEEIITIDWGDGQTKEYKGNRHDDGTVWYSTGAKHTYSQAGTHTIKITGLVTWLECYDELSTSLNARGCTALESLACYNSKLTSLDVRGCTALECLECFNNKLTTLDVSENIALEELDCNGNELTSLDVSKNIALALLWCDDNLLTSKALNKIFTDLPKGKLLEHKEYDQSFIGVSDNPGSDTCNESIAENKGWIVYKH